MVGMRLVPIGARTVGIEIVGKLNGKVTGYEGVSPARDP